MVNTMADEPYTLMPQKEIEELKKQIAELKKNPLGENESSKSLMEAIDTLTSSMNSLMDIFRTAHDELKLDGKDDEVHSKIHDIEQKVDTLIDQNKKIAKGLLTVADMVKAKPKEQAPSPKPQQPPSSPPNFGSPNMGPPPSQREMPNFGGPGPMPPPPGDMTMPPPPANMEDDHKKKGLFHFGK